MNIFSKKLSKTDIETRLTVKTRCLKYFPRFEREQRAQVLRVEDDLGREWFFKLIIRYGKYQKPVLSHGWRDFVKETKLEIGDEVHFSMEGTKYKIRAKKVVKLFGAVISE